MKKNTELTETLVKNAILNWYHATNEHLPVAELERMLADDVKMTYPNSPAPIIGVPAFRKWYADVLSKYFDETHAVEWWDIRIDGDDAVAKVIVRWETRSWPVSDRVSRYSAYLSGQRFVIGRNAETGSVEIREKHVETFEPTSPVYGPFVKVGGPSGQCMDVGEAVNAARTGDLKALSRWLDAGGNPDQYDVEGWTPLLAAAVRGQADAAELLLAGPHRGADPQLQHRPSGALPIHFAGHSGDVRTAETILDVRPDHLNAVWNLNGHTLFLQAVFYDHRDLARFALERGADTAITTIRGLGGLELARQFQNRAMMELIEPYDRPESEKTAYIGAFLERIAPIVPAAEQAAQQRADRLVRMIDLGLRDAAQDASIVDQRVGEIVEFVDSEAIDVNRLGGPLQQPAIVVAVTGNNGEPANPAVARFRATLVEELLKRGADPTLQERHPMAVNAIIRAAVFNHLDILKSMGVALSCEELTDALNEQPSVNGLTALHDTVLRAGTAGANRIRGYLDQIRWLVEMGARSDIEDFSGRTQRMIAERVQDFDRRGLILDALG